MPSTVADIFSAANATSVGVIPWGQTPDLPPGGAEPLTGIYIVALTDRVDTLHEARPTAPISAGRVEELLRERPELKLDGVRPSKDQLTARLAGFWTPDEIVVYIGLSNARRSRPRIGELANRVVEYYDTPLGANSPHAGGWPVKALTCLDDLYVHYAYLRDAETAEATCLRRFAEHLSDASRANLHDCDHIMPYANLEYPKGTRKRHGITGARAPRMRPRS